MNYYHFQDESFKDKTLSLPGAQPVETLETVKRLLISERPSDFKVSNKSIEIH